MRAQILILILLLTASFVVGTQTALAADPQCKDSADGCNDCPAPKGTCDPDTQVCAVWKQDCLNLVPGSSYPDTRVTNDMTCQVPEEDANGNDIDTNTVCSKLQKPQYINTSSVGVCDEYVSGQCDSWKKECDSAGGTPVPKLIEGKAAHTQYTCESGVAQKSTNPAPEGAALCDACIKGSPCDTEGSFKVRCSQITSGKIYETNSNTYGCYVLSPNTCQGSGATQDQINGAEEAVDYTTRNTGGGSVGGPGVFVPMVGIPGLGNKTYTSLPELINALYVFLISMGAVVGVIKIALAGVKYATSDIGGSKSAAKEDIKGVLLGLLILTTPYIVLSIINPHFTNLDVLKLSPLEPSQSDNSSTFQGAPSLDQYTTQCPTTCEETDTGSSKCQSFRNQCVSGGGQAFQPNSTTAACTKNNPCENVCKVVPGTNCPTFNLPTDDGSHTIPNTNPNPQQPPPPGTMCFSCDTTQSGCPEKLRAACTGGKIYQAGDILFQCYINGAQCPANPFNG